MPHERLMIGSADEDRQLAIRIVAGDEEAFEKFFEGHFPGLYRFALARVNGDEDAAEEAAQVTLCKALTKMHTYRGEATLFTWLCTFCRHEISAYYNRNRAGTRQVALIEDIPEVRAALESLASDLQGGPEQLLEAKEQSRLVQVVLDHLPVHYGNALEWKYIDDLSVREIAGRLGLSPKAAESLLTRAREAFREGYGALTRQALSFTPGPLPSGGA